MPEFTSMTAIGKLYGVSSHQVGKWLKSLGLRTEKGKPSSEAFAEGFVAQRPSRGESTYFYVWHTAKTTEMLDNMGFERRE